MRDRRTTPDPELVTGSAQAQIIVPVANLLRRPDGPRDRQMLMGETATVLNTSGGHSYVQADKDGYCGFLEANALGAPSAATHRVNAPATHCYEDADMKSADIMALSHGSRLTALRHVPGFIETGFGFIPLQHVVPVHSHDADPVQVAELFLGTPYLWGGNSRQGIDCSGLVQAALTACGRDCPGDSDLQELHLGRKLPAETEPQRGDLLFWKGHVALVADDTTLIHANAHHMAVAFENIAAAIARIAQQGDGQVTAHIRPGP